MGFDITGLGSVFDFAGKVVDKLFPDPTQKAQAQLELFKLQQSGELAKLAAETDLAKAQIAVNQEEAKSTNWFVAGGRPFIMWICGFAFAYASVGEPCARFVATVIFHYAGQFPVIDTNITLQVLLGLLGLGGMRSFEKMRGVEGNR